jgi:hypothetical protein
LFFCSCLTNSSSKIRLLPSFAAAHITTTFEKPALLNEGSFQVDRFFVVVAHPAARQSRVKIKKSDIIRSFAMFISL